VSTGHAVLAIDQGTSSTKALVVDAEGTVVAMAEVAVHPIAGTDGRVEVDPEELWHSVVDAGRAALAAAGGVEVGAVGLANQGETVLAWDAETAMPLTPALVWQDRRASSVCERLAADGWASRLTEITGLELDPYFVAPKLTWLREHLTTAGTAGTSDTWLVRRLTGESITDAATASRSLLLDLDTGTWSEEACGAFAIDPATLPPIVDCAGPVGTTDAFGPTLPLTGVAVDQQAALFAESCFAAGDVKCTYGTGAFLLANSGGDAHRSRHGLVSCIAWRLDGVDTYCLDGQVFTVGAAVGWLEEIGLIATPSDLDAVGGSVSGSGGVVFVPGLAGLGAPFWAPHARGSFVGLTLATTRAHLVRAVVEGIAAQVAWLARAAAADLGAPLTRLRVDGGLTRSRTLLQTQADLVQVPVEVYPSPHATALGVAAFARLGNGEATSPDAAVGDWRPVAVYEPSIDAGRADEILHAWRDAAEATLDLHTP
jgi:glycerol kinase